MFNNLFQSTILKYALILTVAGLIIFIIISIMLSNITTKTPPLPPAEEQQITDPTNDQPDSTDPAQPAIQIVFTGEKNPDISRAGIYQANQPSLMQANLIKTMTETLIERYSLESIYDEAAVAIYTSKSHALTINLPENSVDFSRNDPTNIEGAINQDQAIAAANDFLKIILPEQNLSPLIDNIEYLKGGYHLEPSTKMAASVVLVPFAHTLEGIPIYVDQRPEPFATIMINANLQVQKASFQAIKTDPQKIQTSEINPIESVLENIANRINSELISFSETEQQLAQAPTLNRTTQATLVSAQLEYRLDPKLKLIYPFYRFEGELVDVDGISFKGEIITPAVKLER